MEENNNIEKNVLQKIQSELKAPKSQRNNFGNYNYRSAEDILEAVKPILAKYHVCIISNDEIVEIADRVYIKTTVMLAHGERPFASATAFAREPLSKKGMDESQITGATASYAKKYALNGLLAIDDSKDADFTNKHEKKSPATKVANNNNDLI